MNFGQNLYNWFLSNAQSLVLLAIVVIGLYLGFKREFSKLIGFLIIAIIAVGLSLTVEYIDQQTKATQVSQFDLVLEKNGSNWKIIE
ncbi:hypothetical protein CLONEX_03344 [[Clostridium] nexile DSM 1787]|nr:hypothetical protein CLONEX_03344 [[Clostridium] nexile DSM 1787]